MIAELAITDWPAGAKDVAARHAAEFICSEAEWEVLTEHHSGLPAAKNIHAMSLIFRASVLGQLLHPACDPS